MFIKDAGKLDDPYLAEVTLDNVDADGIAVSRGMLNGPYWALHAIKTVTGEVVPPMQYSAAMIVR